MLENTSLLLHYTLYYCMPSKFMKLAKLNRRAPAHLQFYILSEFSDWSRQSQYILRAIYFQKIYFSGEIPSNYLEPYKVSQFWLFEFGCFKKSQFLKSTKISGNGPWVNRMNSCIGQGCSSTYKVVKLSNKRPVAKMYIGWATSLSYTYMSSFYLSRDHLLKFWWKNVQNWWIWKIDFFLKQPNCNIRNSEKK